MALPVSEQILQAVRTRLLLIDEGDGYEVTVSGVIRSTRIAGHIPEDWQLTVSLVSITESEADYRPGNPPAIAWSMEIVIMGELRPSESDTTPIDTYRSTFQADIVKAITSTGNDWHNWGNLAIDTTYGAAETIETESGSAIGVPLTILFRTDENDPYTARG